MLKFVREKLRAFRQTIVTAIMFVALALAGLLFGYDVTHLAPEFGARVEQEFMKFEAVGEVILPTDPRHPNFKGDALAVFPPAADAGN